MDELIVRALRAVACVTRLRILSRLAGVDELTLTRLAGDLRLRRDLVCLHLARLAAVGLVRRRRSGRRCYCIAGSPYGPNTVSGDLAAWLCSALRSERALPGHAGAPAHRFGRTRGTLPELHRLILDATTAFTNPRRLQILRHLACGKPASATQLTGELRMSGSALERHLGKLIRRGYVRKLRSGPQPSYCLAPTAKTPHHARLMAIVQAHWGRAECAT